MRNLRQQAEQPLPYPITTFIYGLIDPRTGNVRYVGKANDPETRLRLHLIPSQVNDKTYRGNWLRGLLADGLKPRLVILEEVERRNWQSEEKKWIRIFRKIPGYPKLTNGTDGGEGVEGWVPSEEYRRQRSIAQTGRKMPPGTGAKISATNRGVPKSAEARRQFSKGQKNRWKNASEEERQKMLKNLRNPPSEEKLKVKADRARGRHRPKNPTSQFINVFKVGKQKGKTIWRAGCSIKNKYHRIGDFFIEEEAARARDRFVLKHIGEHIILNFPRSEYEDDPSKIIVKDEKPNPRQTYMHKDNTSGFKGVFKNGKNGWTASITYMGVCYRLGTHRTKEEAARRYDLKAIELLGDRAVLNFPRSTYEFHVAPAPEPTATPTASLQPVSAQLSSSW